MTPGVVVICGMLAGANCGDVQLDALMRYKELGDWRNVEKVCQAYRRYVRHGPADDRFDKECGKPA